ncbi:MAG: putative 2-aminoethylphosphonate ABC transporter ATP-binding protein [Geminicoccaceae bacterium]
MVAHAKEAGAERKPYLRITGLSKQFGTFTALEDISLELYEGELVCFLGPSGCGKTTLLRAIAGLDIQTRGTIEQAGKDISALPPAERDFGIVFQSYALFPNLTVARNIAYGLENRGLKRADIQKRVADLLALIGLPDQGHKYPAQLSGGQQQRVALARAIATSPGLLLLDEPLSALDAKVRMRLRQEVRGLQRRLGVTTIMVTHDQEEALTMADRIVVMNHGVIEQTGTALEVYRDPKTPFVADFVGTMNFLSATVIDAGRVRLGEVELACKANGFAAGERVTVAVRPEGIIVNEGGAPPENSFAAKVGWMEFLGHFFRADLETDALGSNRLVADFSINMVGRTGVAEGSAVTLVVPSERIRVYPETASRG